MSAQIKLRRDTAANWTSVNPVLASGEPGLETDTLKVKYGDGSTAWNLLSYPQVTFPSTISNATTATNLSGGSANQLAFQTGAGTTSFISAPTQVGYLQWTGTGFNWANSIVNASQLNGTNLATNIVSSSLTTVGTLNSLTVGGQTNITVGTQSSSSTTGALVVTGGIGASGNIYTAGNMVVSSTTASTSTTSGALQVAGGMGVAGNTYIGGNLIVTGTITTLTGETITGNLSVSGTETLGGQNLRSLSLAMAAALS
jgi:hypothetical protein